METIEDFKNLAGPVFGAVANFAKSMGKTFDEALDDIRDLVDKQAETVQANTDKPEIMNLVIDNIRNIAYKAVIDVYYPALED